MFDPHVFYSVEQIRVGSHAPRALVYSALENGELRALRRGKRWLVPGSAVIEWLEAQAMPLLNRKEPAP